MKGNSHDYDRLADDLADVIDELGVNLQGAFLRRANLRGADLGDANLRETDNEPAHAIFMSVRSLNRIRYSLCVKGVNWG